MEGFSAETLTILVLIAVILVGVTFISITILIIYVSCKKYRRPKSINPVSIRSSISSVSDDNRPASVSPFSSSSSSITSIPLKTSVTSTSQHQRQEQSSQQRKYGNTSISVRDERPFNNQKNKQQVYKHDESDETTIISGSRVYNQHYQPRQQQSFKTITDVRFIERNTPYPPEILARERVMMNHLRFPGTSKYNEE